MDLECLSIPPQDAARQIEMLECFMDGVEDFFDSKKKGNNNSAFTITFPLHRGENRDKVVSAIYEALAAPTKRSADDLSELQDSFVLKESRKSVTVRFHERAAKLHAFIPGYIERLRPIAAACNKGHAATEALLDLAEGKQQMSRYDLLEKIRTLLEQGADATATRDGIMLRDLATDKLEFLECLNKITEDRIKPWVHVKQKKPPAIER